jgi:hypothetical protein
MSIKPWNVEQPALHIDGVQLATHTLLLATKTFIPHVLAFILSWKVYKQDVLFYIFIFKNMGIWDEPIKTT